MWCSLHSEPRSTCILKLICNDLQLRNLHDFMHSGCSTHLRLHFRIVRILTRHRLCSFCTTGTSTFLSMRFHSFPCLLRRWQCIKFREFLPIDQRTEHVALPLLSGRFESVWTWRYMSLCSTCGTRSTAHFCWSLPLCHHGSPW